MSNSRSVFRSRNPRALARGASLSLILACFLIAGCSYVRQKNMLQEQTVQLQEELRRKEQQVAKLEELLQEKDSLIREKELKIKELRKKLASLGVF